MSVVVVGDVLLDVDLLGTADRLSPDAPVPVVDVADAVRRPGGAGLVALMLARDGHHVRLVTVLSDDSRVDELRAALGPVEVVAGRSGAPTPVKTRVRAAGQSVVRVDEGCAPAPAPEVTGAMLEAVQDADVVVAADYGRGLLADDRLRDALEHRRAGVPLVWDPHVRGADPVRGATVVTPNLAEAAAAVPGTGRGTAAAARAAAVLRERWAAQAVVVTLGEHGALLLHGSTPLVLPAPGTVAHDPCGAGDRLAATLAAELLAGTDLPGAVDAAVRSASGFLAAGGVAALIGPDALDRPSAAGGAPGPGSGASEPGSGASEPGGDGTSPPAPSWAGPTAEALELIRRTRAAGGTVVATGGCFDLLHAGHARTLAAARALGDCLVVCLNSDDSIRRLKGPERPIISQEDRVDLLTALGCVDAVVVFDEDSPHEVLGRLRPDVWVKGGDYAVDTLPEAALVESWGGCTVTVPFHPGRSTTRLAGALARVG